MVKHTRPTEAVRERAALHVLGSLDAAASRELEEHIRAGCRVCGTEVAAFAEVAADVALTATPVPPRPDARARLLAAMRASERSVDAEGSIASGRLVEAGGSITDARSAAAVGPSRFSFTLADEGHWYEVSPGVARKDLTAPDSSSPSFLIRMQARSMVDTHLHEALEHCFVVEGDLHVAGRHLYAGDYHRAAPGTVHETIRSDGGCLLLIVEARA